LKNPKQKFQSIPATFFENQTRAMLSTKRKLGLPPQVQTMTVKGINSVVSTHTVPGGGFFFVCRNNRVGRVSIEWGNQMSQIAGHALGYDGNRDGVGADAMFRCPEELTQDEIGNLIVLDTDNNSLRKVRQGGLVSTFAGPGAVGFDPDMPGADKFDSPKGMAISENGVIAVADTSNNRICLVAKTGRVTHLCGGPMAGYQDGPRDVVRFDEPSAIIPLPNGSWLVFIMTRACYVAHVTFAHTVHVKAASAQVADSGNNRLREVFPDGTTTTWAGGEKGFKNGPRLRAQFNYPMGLAMTWDGIVLVADKDNNRVRQIDGQQVSTLAGTGAFGPASKQPPCDACFATLRRPTRVAICHNGDVLVCEESPRDDEIRVITETGLSPAVHHKKKIMSQVIQGAATEIVRVVTDKCSRHLEQDAMATCETALLSVNASAQHRESFGALLKDSEFHGMLYCTLAQALCFLHTDAKCYLCRHVRDDRTKRPASRYAILHARARALFIAH
jgi:hypothetical protein